MSINSSLSAASIEAANRINRLLAITVLCLAIAVAVLTFTISTRDAKIEISPFGLDATIEISANSANAEYYKSFGLYVASMAANINPKNVKFVTENLSLFMSSKAYGAVRNALLAKAQDPIFLKSGSSVYFVVEQTPIYEPETSKVFILGTANTIAAAGLVSADPFVYEMTLSMSNRRPVIEDIVNYPGTEPHTLKWLEAHKQDSEKK